MFNFGFVSSPVRCTSPTALSPTWKARTRLSPAVARSAAQRSKTTTLRPTLSKPKEAPSSARKQVSYLRSTRIWRTGNEQTMKHCKQSGRVSSYLFAHLARRFLDYLSAGTKAPSPWKAAETFRLKISAWKRSANSVFQTAW